jgi:TRAP transporter TAXI family solute receptor
VVLDRLGVAESAAALKDRRIDAFVWSGGLPTAAVQDLTNSPNVRLRFVESAEAVPALVQRFGPLYFPLVIPRTMYGTARDARVIGVANLLVARADFDEELAYRITRSLFEHKADLALVHPEAAKLDLATAGREPPVPLHPGAARYYRERGVLSDRH